MMDDLEKIMRALRKAHEAGDTESAARLARMAREAKAKSYVEDVVATTPDGGRVVRAADGALSFTSPGYSTSDPAKIEEIMKGAEPAKVSRDSFDQTTLDQTSGFVNKFAQGLPFVGQYADEAVGALYGPGARDAMRASQAAMERQRPVMGTLAQIAGGITGAVPLAVMAGPSIAAAAPNALAPRVLAGLGAGAAAGATEGAISGYGRGNDGDRMRTARDDAMTGGAFGAVVGGAGPALGAAFNSIARRLKGVDIDTIARTLGISKDAARALKPDLDALDFPSAQANIAKAGPDAMLADAGIPTREALDMAITGGGKAARVGIEAVARRAAASGNRLAQVMDAVLGAPQGIKSAARSISQRTAGIRSKAYERAYSTAINYADDAGRRIEDVLSKIPDDTLRSAIKEANEAMQAAGIRNRQIMAQIAQDGSVRFVEMPNVQQLDEIKKALGAIGAEVDALGRPTAKARRANMLAAELRDAVGEAVPSYRTAVRLGGDKIAEDRALDMGRRMFGPSVSREDVAAMMKNSSLQAKDAARQGIREYVDDVLSRVRRSYDDPSVDTTETLRLLNTLSSRDAREKLTLVLGEDKANRLFAEIDSVGRQFGTRQAIATGSATGRRQARMTAFNMTQEPGVISSAARGEVGGSLRAFLQMVTRETPENQLAQKQQVLGEIAQALTEIRGPQAEAALRIVQKALDGQILKNDEAARVARLLSGGLALGGYLSGTRTTQGQLAGPQ